MTMWTQCGKVKGGATESYHYSLQLSSALHFQLQQAAVFKLEPVKTNGHYPLNTKQQIDTVND